MVCLLTGQTNTRPMPHKARQNAVVRTLVLRKTHTAKRFAPQTHMQGTATMGMHTHHHSSCQHTQGSYNSSTTTLHGKAAAATCSASSSSSSLVGRRLLLLLPPVPHMIWKLALANTMIATCYNVHRHNTATRKQGSCSHPLHHQHTQQHNATASCELPVSPLQDKVVIKQHKLPSSLV
jgi:hypothetical protein